MLDFAEFPDQPFGDHTLVAGGVPRKLAALAPHPERLALARGYRAQGLPVLPPTQWRECDYDFYGTPLWDQKTHGSCTNAAGGDALEQAMRMVGWKPPLLSRTFAYAQVNGGRDQGASVTSILQVFEQLGVCTDANCGVDTIYKQDVPRAAYDEAPLYKVPADTLQGAFLLRSFEELCSAQTLGFPIVFGIKVGRNFSQLSSEGVCPPPDMVIGGHALSGRGLKKSRSGQWLVKFRNSWLQWGINGCAFLSQVSFDRMIDAYAIIMPAVTRADPNLPPAVVLATPPPQAFAAPRSTSFVLGGGPDLKELFPPVPVPEGADLVGVPLDDTPVKVVDPPQELSPIAAVMAEEDQKVLDFINNAPVAPESPTLPDVVDELTANAREAVAEPTPDEEKAFYAELAAEEAKRAAERPPPTETDDGRSQDP